MICEVMLAFGMAAKCCHLPIINGQSIIDEPINNNNEPIMSNESKKRNGGGGGNGRGNASQQHNGVDSVDSPQFGMADRYNLRSAFGQGTIGPNMNGNGEQNVPIDLEPREFRPRKQQRISSAPLGGAAKTSSSSAAGGVDKISPTAPAPDQHQIANSRDSVNSSNSGASVVKFAAMPAVVAYTEPGNSGWPSSNHGPGIKVSRIQNNGGTGVGIQSVGQGINNFSGASSGSLSSEGNNATGSSLSLSSGGSREKDGKKKIPSGSLLKTRPDPGPQGNKQISSETSNMTNSGDDDKAPPTSNTNMKSSSSNSRTSTSNGGSSGSGSDNNGGATSSSGNPAVVTASTANNNTTSSGSGDDRSSSGSGGGSGSGSGGGNRRSAGEASGEYYYAGYGSGPSLGGTSSNQAASVGAPQAQGAAALQAMGVNNNMPSFASFQGAPLAAASAAAAAGPNAQAQQAGLGPQNNNAASNMGARHVVVATDEGGLPPPPHAFASHLRHHSRHYHNHRSRRSDVAQAPGVDTTGINAEGAAMPQAPPANAAAAAAHRPGAAPMNGIPSAIGGPAAAARLPPSQQAQHYRGASAHPTVSNHYELRLPPSDEQAVLQRVPRTHATVVAHDLPPPPTSSDAWSSTSGGSSSRSRKRTSAGANANSAGAAVTGQPMVASVRLANGGTVDSVNMNDGSPSSSDSQPSLGEQQNVGAGAMHVTMDDPILRKKISLKHEQVPSKPSLESKPSPDEAPAVGTTSKTAKAVSGSKRKMSAIARANTSDDSSDGAKSETEAVGSGSDEGYAASSERQSGSGSDSISSDDAKKEKVASSARAPGAAGQSKNKVGGVTMASQSNSKRTETSSMSSSVLADFSSVMNEEGSIAINSLSRSDSPRSSCTSLSSDLNGGGAGAGAEAAKTSQDANAGGKRDSAHLNVSSSARKRSKSDPGDANNKQSAANSGPGNNAMKNGLSIMEKSLQQKVRSAHHHHYHSRSTGRKMLEKSFLSAKRDLSTAEDAASALAATGVEFHDGKSNDNHLMNQDAPFQDASIYSLGQDVMAQVVAFLEPPEIHSFLTTPFSKTWLITYTAPQELWKILCTSKPFYAKLDDAPCGSSDASTCSFPICNDLEMRHLFGRYRLLYTSFVRCMKYLNRLQDDALNGRTPSVYTNADQADIYPYNKNTSLKAYFAKARRLVRSSRLNGGSRSSSDAALSITSESGSHGSEKIRRNATASGTVSANGAQQNNSSSRRLGRSMLTDRLLRPTQAGDVDNVNLPWSCAIYSVVNWMVAFADVEGIQIMCLKCLPYLLEDESQRTTAQRAGLTDSVLRAMVLFPDSIELHTVAFHTLVLLARPLGGNEGMLFHTAMVNTRGIFNNGSSNSKNGIVIMLDSMRRFAQDEILQAMSCWSLVNVALTPLQKSMLVKLGGLTVTSNAMLQHPYNAEVQFRALFALINLVIPTETRPDETEEMREFEREIFQQLGEVGETSEKEMLDASVGQISNLVVVAMKNFCSSEAILNRACLVLHNLSLNEEYHSILLWTPNCYQMLEWCLGNYPHDHVLQQSAGGTIQRLNATLSADEELRARFTHSIRAQQQHSLELARQEAVLLQEQQQEQEQQQMDLS